MQQHCFWGVQQAARTCSSLILFYSSFLCLPTLSAPQVCAHTHTQTHGPLWLSLDMLFPSNRILCQAAVTSGRTMHFKYALFWRYTVSVVYLLCESCTRPKQEGEEQGTEQQPSSLWKLKVTVISLLFHTYNNITEESGRDRRNAENDFPLDSKLSQWYCRLNTCSTLDPILDTEIRWLSTPFWSES